MNFNIECVECGGDKHKIAVVNNPNNKDKPVMMFTCDKCKETFVGFPIDGKMVSGFIEYQLNKLKEE